MSAPPSIEFLNSPWQDVMPALAGQADLVICDPVYESADLSWAKAAVDCLKPGGALYAFGDHHRIAETKLELDAHLQFENWLIWPNDWGGRSRRRFGQKHDDILYYAKPGADPSFDGQAVAVPKSTVAAKFNPSGRTTKIPASVWSDLAGFSTTASERVRIGGTCVRWQKPEKVISRIVLASCPPGGLALDFFGGVATVPAVCLASGRDCVSCELDHQVFTAGAMRLAQLSARLAG